ncbi:MAG: cyp51 [Frankiales bacterium]|nr:cyp51 [Frankiales bacterium]
MRPRTLLDRAVAEGKTAFTLRLGTRKAIVLMGEQHHRFVFAETDKNLSISAAYGFLARMYDPDWYVVAEPEEYLRQREVMLPRFGNRQVAGYRDLMLHDAQEFISSLGADGRFEISSTLNTVLLRIAAGCFLGEAFGAILTPEFGELMDDFAGGLTFLPRWLPSSRRRRADRARLALRAIVADELEERRRNVPERTAEDMDFLDVLTSATYADGSALPQRVVVNLVLGVLLGGHETTIGPIGWMLVDLLRNPGELELVRAELDAVLGDDLSPTLAQFMKLKVFDNALRETQRLHPPTTVLARVAVADIEHAGYLIPRGTMVMVTPYGAHRMPEVFEEPARYWPARYTEFPASLNGLINFGGGNHRCLGARFAELEIKVVLGLLLREYDFEMVTAGAKGTSGLGPHHLTSPCFVTYRRRRQPVREEPRTAAAAGES